MCGIVGVLSSKQGTLIDAELIVPMRDAVRARGPDEAGVYCAGPVGLGHRRLVVLDTVSGAQPMLSEDSTNAIAYNGEIYNFRTLREELRSAGHTFRTSSDTDVLLQLYQAKGKECLQSLQGMFAFALWNKSTERLFLARDRVGIKPLYYAVTPQGLIFGSELKALLMCSWLAKPKINPQAVDAFFAYGYIPSPLTIYRDVYKLPAGWSLEASYVEGELRIHKEQYWRLTDGAHAQSSYEEVLAQYEMRLKHTVQDHLVSDVPIGAFLSGGIDSSTVVWMMSQVHDSPVKTFAVGFPEEEKMNELDQARAVAKILRTDHHETLVTSNALTELPHIMAANDEPFGDPSSIPTYYLCQFAREHVTVCLSGDGGDELFAGYKRYFAMHKERAWPQALRAAMSLGKHFACHESRTHNFFSRLRSTLADHYGTFRCNFSTSMRASLFAPEFLRHIQFEETQSLMLGATAPVSVSRNCIEQMQNYDLHGYLIDNVLTKVDRMSMAHSLEARVPLLDHQLIEYVHSLPFEYKASKDCGKRMLRDLLQKKLPPELINRPKQGFSVPLHRWFQSGLKETLRSCIESEVYQKSDFFDGKYIRYLYQRYERGSTDLAWHMWQLLAFYFWYISVRDQCSSEWA